MKIGKGTAATIAWLGFIAIYVVCTWESVWAMTPNEFGDFLTGVFSPVAFLWLVLGYYQQGEELRQQATELRRSVEQQTELAMATKAELEISKQLQVSRAQKEERDAQPVFVVGDPGCTSRPPYKVWFRLTNRGNHISNVAISCREADCSPSYMASMEHGGNFEVELHVIVTERAELEVTISYHDAQDKLRAQQFHLIQSNETEYFPSAIWRADPEDA